MQFDTYMARERERAGKRLTEFIDSAVESARIERKTFGMPGELSEVDEKFAAWNS